MTVSVTLAVIVHQVQICSTPHIERFDTFFQEMSTHYRASCDFVRQNDSCASAGDRKSCWSQKSVSWCSGFKIRSITIVSNANDVTIIFIQLNVVLLGSHSSSPWRCSCSWSNLLFLILHRPQNCAQLAEKHCHTAPCFVQIQRTV